MKQIPRSQLQVDWALFYLRWLVLAVIGVVAFLGPESVQIDSIQARALLVIALAYNMGVFVLLLVRFWPSGLGFATLVLDALVALFAFLIAGDAQSSLLWVGLFPILVAGMRYGWQVSVGLTFSLVFIEALFLLVLDDLGVRALAPYAINALFLLTGALATGLLSERLLRQGGGSSNDDLAAFGGRRAAHDRAKAIYELASLVSASLNYNRVLDAVLDLSVLGLQDASARSENMVGAVLLFDEEELYVASARRLTPNDKRLRVPAKKGILAEAVNSGDPVFSSRPYNDPELSKFVAFRSCRVLMAVPLRAGFDSYGVIVFGHPEPDFFSIDVMELLEAVCNQAIIAMQNARLYQTLQEEKERIVEVEEEARKKLARDLHDGPTQQVAAIAMRANFIRRLLDRDPAQAAEELYKVEELARRTTKEIRHMLFTLRPLVLESRGLEAALKSLADKMREGHDQNVLVEAEEGAEDMLDKHAQGVLFYIAEEAITNARKHAEASIIWVRLRLRGDLFALEIEDNGVGFNVGAVDASYDQRGSLGMVNMRERAELVNGVHRIQSSEGRGTKITVLVPLTEDAEDRLHVL